MSGLNKYQEYLVEAAYKQAVKGKPNTSTLLAWYEESGDLKRRIDFSSIWVDADLIPLEAPLLGNAEYYTKYVNGSPITVLQYNELVPILKKPGTKSTYYSSLLIDCIEPTYGTGYAVHLYDSTDTEIPFGLNKWVVDTESGTITFIEGEPSQYSGPYYVSFYRYSGRKGNEAILTNDGALTMLPTYKPTKDQSIATKVYVDSNISDTSAIVHKLIPNTPPTLEGKDLELVTPHRWARLVTSTDPEVHVVYRNEEYIKLRLSDFWDEGDVGYIQPLVNGNVLATVSIKDLKLGNYDKNIFNVESIHESYPNDIVADDFYHSMTITINIDVALRVMPYMPTPSYPIVSFQVKWYSLQDLEGYLSNKLLVGLDYYRDRGMINDPTLINYNVSNKYISGVPAMVNNEYFKIQMSTYAINTFMKDVHGKYNFDNFTNGTLFTDASYADFYPNLNKTTELVVPDGLATEKITGKIQSYNLDEELIAVYDVDWNIRIDTLSDETNRVSSPDENGENWGKEWGTTKQAQSCKDNNELQMLYGYYQWPKGDYSNNGIGLPFPTVWVRGPNYTDIPRTGTRCVTFKYKLNHSNGFYFTIENAAGFEHNPNDFTFTNIKSLKCIIGNKTEWLDMNTPFDGVLSPYDFDDKACLVVNKSNTKTRYCTFGTEVLSGDLYICLEVPYVENMKFSGISVIGNI